MYAVVLSTLIAINANSVDCCWGRNGHNGSVPYGGCTTCAPVMEMPSGCGCSPCPSCGGMPLPAPPMMGEMGVPTPPPIGDPGMAVPPADGTILPPALGAPGIPPLNPPPALNEERTSPNQAQFVVRLPANARLVVEGTVIPGSGPIRVFVTPPLEPGKEYVYDLAIELDRSGKIIRDQQTVRFQAGKTANVTFSEPRPDTGAPPLAAPMTSRIHVEGRPWTTSVVQTPPLDPARTHYYLLRVETIRDGQRAVIIREVAFRAGQELNVDLRSEKPIAGNVVKNGR
jgi:uncharacterized protein (TIGR03000 family)